MDDLFAGVKPENKKNNKKGLVVSILVFLITLTIATTIIFYVNYKGKVSGKASLLTMLEKHNVSDFVDLDGFAKIIEKQNKSSYTTDSSVKLDDGTDLKGQISSNVAKKRILNNVSLKDLDINMNSAVNSKDKKGKTKFTVKFGDNVIWDIDFMDLGDVLAIGEPTYFKEYIGIDKASLKSLPSWLPQREETLEEEQNRKNIIENLEYNINQEKDINPAKELNNIFSIYKGHLKDKINEILEENIKMERKVPVKYRDKDVKADVITISLDKSKYEEIMKDTLESTQKDVYISKKDYPTIEFLNSIHNTVLGSTLDNLVLPISAENIKSLAGFSNISNSNNENKKENKNNEINALKPLKNNATGLNADNGVVKKDGQALPTNSSEKASADLKSQKPNTVKVIDSALNNGDKKPIVVDPKSSDTNSKVNVSANNNIENVNSNANNNNNNNIDKLNANNDNSKNNNVIDLNESEESKVDIKIYIIGDEDIKIDKLENSSLKDSMEFHLPKNKENLTEFVYSGDDITLPNGDNHLELKLSKTADNGTIYNKLDMKTQKNIYGNKSPENTVIASLNRSENLEGANISVEYDIEKKEAEVVKKANIKQRIKFEDDVKVGLDRAIVKLNTLGALKVREMMKNIIFPTIKKVTTEKLYRLENLGAVGASDKIIEDTTENNVNANANVNNSQSKENDKNKENKKESDKDKNEKSKENDSSKDNDLDKDKDKEKKEN